MKIPNWEHFQTSLPLTVQEVGCHGKFIYLRLEGDLALGIGLGMSGTLNFKVDDKQNHIRLGLRSTLGERNKDTLCYYDYRRFGNWCVYLTQAELDRKLNQLGLNILGTNAPTREEVDFVYRRAQNQNICRVLMNQKLFSGIGNCL